MRKFLSLFLGFSLILAPITLAPKPVYASVSTASCYGTDCSSILHLDGTIGSQTILDSSSNALTWTAGGNANLDTGFKKFGVSSVFLDGTGDYLESADNALFYVPADFTIDFWVRFAALTTSRTLFFQRTDATNYMEGAWIATNNFSFKIVAAGSTTVAYSQAWTPSIGQFYHVAVVHSGTNYVVYIDGTSLGTLSDVDVPADYTGSFEVGRSNISGVSVQEVNGWIDEFTFTKNKAKYSGNFTPQTVAYTACAATSKGKFFNLIRK